MKFKSGDLIILDNETRHHVCILKLVTRDEYRILWTFTSPIHSNYSDTYPFNKIERNYHLLTDIFRGEL